STTHTYPLSPYTTLFRSSTATGSANTASMRVLGACCLITDMWSAEVKPDVSTSWFEIFRVMHRRAAVLSRAAAKSGTSRCTSTDVNHDPGPRMTQSASSIAFTASVEAGGSWG